MFMLHVSTNFLANSGKNFFILEEWISNLLIKCYMINILIKSALKILSFFMFANINYLHHNYRIVYFVLHGKIKNNTKIESQYFGIFYINYINNRKSLLTYNRVSGEITQVLLKFVYRVNAFYTFRLHNCDIGGNTLPKVLNLPFYHILLIAKERESKISSVKRYRNNQLLFYFARSHFIKRFTINTTYHRFVLVKYCIILSICQKKYP